MTNAPPQKSTEILNYKLKYESYKPLDNTKTEV